ncbi:uncharacterized protein EV422DRAFT_544611 [Fimicolochytrium jonesii]|uniref:uncharacterized protein n=1 Tax=Fimicolochytrium jonesii TaxID=1396493 RepID=UPI0022FDB899|nr:uncharacterized protein EV422DRAFT_544611 [Fimicolochytrium jonesii]KAI8816733.1 hypothetical protein EV422DRAFT_544611 [Fimicolochytrium jonesii]
MPLAVMRMLLPTCSLARVKAYWRSRRSLFLGRIHTFNHESLSHIEYGGDIKVEVAGNNQGTIRAPGSLYIAQIPLAKLDQKEE